MFQSTVAPKSPRAFSPAQTGKFFILQLGSYAPPFTAWNSQVCLGLPMKNIHARYLVCIICKKIKYCYYCYSVIMFSKYNRFPMQQEPSALHRLEKVFYFANALHSMEQPKVFRIANVKIYILGFLVCPRKYIFAVFIQCNSKSIKFIYVRQYIRGTSLLLSMCQNSKFTICCLFWKSYNSNNSNSIKFINI